VLVIVFIGLCDYQEKLHDDFPVESIAEAADLLSPLATSDCLSQYLKQVICNRSFILFYHNIFNVCITERQICV